VITVRRAVDSDVLAMSRTMIASIRELCAADHGNDPESVASWIGNKSEEGVRAMLANADNQLFVAELAGAVAAVGCIRFANQIALNYVDPDHRFRGISTGLLGAMEDAIRKAGVNEATVVSTATARRFYLARGWQESGPGAPRTGYPMHKRL
jgi:GNAT superfamily N-acetyltransferase